MSDTILIRGFTASDPALSTPPNGVPVVNFRLASTLAGGMLPAPGRRHHQLVHRESLPSPRPEHCHIH